MNQQEEIFDRWFRVFEHTETDLKLAAIERIKTHVPDDVWFLRNRVKDLERELAEIQNPIGSRYGALTHIEHGEMMYQINGAFIRVSTLKELLDYHLKHPEIEGFTPETREELLRILSLVSDM